MKTAAAAKSLQSCNSVQPHRRQSTRLCRPWDSPGKNTGVGCHFLLQESFLTQRSNLGLLHCRQILYLLNHQGSPWPSPSHLSFVSIGVYSSMTGVCAKRGWASCVGTTGQSILSWQKRGRNSVIDLCGDNKESRGAGQEMAGEPIFARWDESCFSDVF